MKKLFTTLLILSASLTANAGSMNLTPELVTKFNASIQPMVGTRIRSGGESAEITTFALMHINQSAIFFYAMEFEMPAPKDVSDKSIIGVFKDIASREMCNDDIKKLYLFSNVESLTIDTTVVFSNDREVNFEVDCK